MEATFFFFFFFEIRRRQTKFPSYEDEDNAPLVGFCWLPSVNKTPPFVSLSVSAILIKTRPPIGCTFVYFFGTSNGFPAIAIQVFPLRGLLLDDFTTFDLDNNDEDDENAAVVAAILTFMKRF